MTGSKDRWRGRLALGFVALVIAASASLVAGRNLAWDDADYLRDGLRVANSVRLDGPSRPGHALTSLLRVQPKPPLLVGWIAAGGLIPALRTPSSLYLFASLIPFVILLLVVAAVASSRSGRRGGFFALLILAASPMALSFGAKVMVETFMGVWVLLAIWSMARLLDAPGRGRALALGVPLALACLTKMTAALLMPVPSALALVLMVRRHGLSKATAAMGWVVAVASSIAAPWYLRNGAAAIRFARFSARYNLEALGTPGRVGSMDRLPAIGRDLAGWPVVALALVAGFVAFGEWRRSKARSEAGSTDDFALLAVACFASGALILQVPLYFDPRFLLPAWPSVAVVLGASLARIRWSSDRVPSLATGALLAVALVGSFGRLADDPKTTTFWAARPLIDHLVARYRIANLYNVGNCQDWNVSKTGLANEFRDDPRDCFVLHDLSGSLPPKFLKRLEGAEAVVMLDRSKLPTSWFAYGPALNRSCDFALAHLANDRQFLRVEDYPAAGLPPLLVFVRRDLRSARAVR